MILIEGSFRFPVERNSDAAEEIARVVAASRALAEFNEYS